MYTTSISAKAGGNLFEDDNIAYMYNGEFTGLSRVVRNWFGTFNSRSYLPLREIREFYRLYRAMGADAFNGWWLP